MQDQPHVSQFTLHNDLPQPPHIPQLIRSRHKPLPASRLSHPSSHSPLQPKEIIIEVQTPSKGLPKQAHGVRAHIDACLQAIQQSSWNVKRRYYPKQSPGQTVAAQQVTKRQATEIQADVDSPPRLRDQSIHRVDNRLIMDYLSTVGREYRLRDPFGPSNRTLECQTPRNPNKSSSSIEARHKKQYINLTQTSRNDKRSHSTNHKQKVIYSSEQVNAQPFSMPPKEQRIILNTVNDKGVRYCVNCEQAVWSADTDVHESQCQGFQRLYSLSFQDLSQLVRSKVHRMAQELESRIRFLNEKKEGILKIDSITHFTLQRLWQYLKTLEKGANDQYLNFEQSLRNPYMEAIELTHRLHWFTQVAQQLQSQTQYTKGTQRFLGQIAGERQQPNPLRSPISQLREDSRLFHGAVQRPTM